MIQTSKQKFCLKGEIVMKAKGKNIIVTGGGNGVGRELVLQLLEKGATVIAVDINLDALNETVKIARNSDSLYIYVVDISDKEEVFSFAEKVVKEHKKIDGIINNAGIIQPFVHIKDLEMDRIDRVMKINFYGTLYMIKAFLPYLMNQPEAHIVNISSMGGILPVPGQSVYGASKVAVKLLSEGLSSELINTNVNVSIIIPGGIATNIVKNSNISFNDLSKNKKSNMLLIPQKAAELIIMAMEKNRLRTYIGKDCKIMNMLYKINSGLAMKMINKVMNIIDH